MFGAGLTGNSDRLKTEEYKYKYIRDESEERYDAPALSQSKGKRESGENGKSHAKTQSRKERKKRFKACRDGASPVH